jgi:hypothetical protein
MRPPKRGLTALPDEDLIKLMRRLHGGTLDFPLTRHGMLLRGLNRIAEHGDLLFGLDEAGVRAVLVAVIAERQRSSEQLVRLEAAREAAEAQARTA